MATKPRYAACEVRQAQYHAHWETDLLSATSEAPGFCCYALWCGYCASYQLRKRVLYNDMSRYLCCGGFMPCSGRCGEQKCPEACLCVEVSCCFAQSVASTRWMIQDAMHLQNTKCDNCLIGTTIALQYLACIMDIAACVSGNDAVREAAHIIDYIADLMWCSVCACMQTQHKVQLDARDADPSLVQPLDPFMAPHLQAMGVPAYAPPPGAYGGGPPQHYPPPPQGYYPPPPQGYYPPPPQGYYPPANK